MRGQLALENVTALVTIVLTDDPDNTLGDALDRAVAGLGEASDVALASAVGSVAVVLLERLAGATGRDREDLWREIAHGLAVCDIGKEQEG